MRRATWPFASAFFMTWASALAQVEPVPAGKILVANDEWTLSNVGFEAGPDASVFATNIASWFTNGRPGVFLVYSNHFGLTQDSLAAVMTRAGHTWTVSTTDPFDTETLRNYDGVFLGGFPADNQTLIDYVWGGGNVYICGGTDAIDEASAYNGFLNPFNFSFESHNGVSRPGESHPRALAEPYVNVSVHTAPIIQPRAVAPWSSERKAWDHVSRFGQASGSLADDVSEGACTCAWPSASAPGRTYAE